MLSRHHPVPLLCFSRNLPTGGQCLIFLPSLLLASTGPLQVRKGPDVPRPLRHQRLARAHGADEGLGAAGGPAHSHSAHVPFRQVCGVPGGLAYTNPCFCPCVSPALLAEAAVHVLIPYLMTTHPSYPVLACVRPRPLLCTRLQAALPLSQRRNPCCLAVSDVEEGGETAFPYGRWIDAERQAAPPYTECAARGTAVKPRKGDAVLFFSLKPDGGWWPGGEGRCGCPAHAAGGLLHWCAPCANWLGRPVVAEAGGHLAAMACSLGNAAALAKSKSAALFTPCSAMARAPCAPLAGRKKDVYSFHAGCPVVRGVKFSATVWVGGRPACRKQRPPGPFPALALKGWGCDALSTLPSSRCSVEPAHQASSLACDAAASCPVGKRWHAGSGAFTSCCTEFRLVRRSLSSIWVPLLSISTSRASRTKSYPCYLGCRYMSRTLGRQMSQIRRQRAAPTRDQSARTGRQVRRGEPSPQQWGPSLLFASLA